MPISICTWWTRTATKSTTVDRRSKAAVCSTSIRTAGPERYIRNEHIGWSQGTPPPGIYEVRVDYWENCDAPETNYIVNVYNRGHVSTFSGTFTGPGDEGGRDSGRVITQFEIPGGKPRPPVATNIVSTYRGGDQVFVLNPDGEVLDDTLYTLHLGNASAEVYLIATNTAHYRMEPRIERLDLLEAAAKGLRAAHTEHQQQSRPPMTAATDHRPWVTEFNNNPPLDAGLADDRSRAQQQEPRQPVAAGDTVAFLDLDQDDNLVEIPSTARSVVTDGVTTVAVWVADADWGSACGGGTDAVPTGRAAHVVTKDCVTQQMTDAVADQFLRPGAGNDIYDWVSNIFGAPWGPHSHPLGIPRRLPARSTYCCSTSMATAPRKWESPASWASSPVGTTSCDCPTIRFSRRRTNG